MARNQLRQNLIKKIATRHERGYNFTLSQSVRKTARVCDINKNQPDRIMEIL